MPVGESFRYIPGMLIGEPRRTENQFSSHPAVHANVRNGNGYQVCNCGLVASVLAGNRGHRDQKTGELATEGYFAEWDDVNWNSDDEDMKYVSYSCFCGEWVFSSPTVPLIAIPNNLAKHRCLIVGEGPAGIDARARAVEALAREVFINLSGTTYRIQAQDPMQSFNREKVKDSTIYVYGFAHFSYAVEGLLRNHPWIADWVQTAPVTIGGTQEESTAILIKRNQGLSDILDLLDSEATEWGLDGYFIFQHGIVTQRPVLTPEFRFAAHKGMIQLQVQ